MTRIRPSHSTRRQLIAAHGGDAVGIWQGGGSDLSAALHTAWGAFATTGDPGWAPYAWAGLRR